MARFFWQIGLTVACAVAVTVFAAQSCRADPPGRSVYLHGARDFLLPEEHYPYQGLLARQLVREAFLMAAREELGLRTVDLHLGQRPPAGARELDIVCIPGLDKPNGPPTRLEILSGVPPVQRLVAAELFLVNPPIELVAIVKDCEARSRGSFVKILEATGLSGKPRDWNPNAELPAGVSALLSEMNFISQFRAACALHEANSREGQSAQLAAALSRSYANLGLLTNLDWAPAHKVFTARSLLYAERLVAQKRDLGPAYSARAYAYALAGLHKSALDDLDTLDQLAFQGRAQVDDTAVILRDYCRFRFDLLEPDRFGAGQRDLVWLLRVLAREESGSPLQNIEECLEALKFAPHCYRLQASLCRRAGVSLGHSATLEGPSRTARTIYSRLLAMPQLPAEARAICTATMPGEMPADQLGLPGIDFSLEFPARSKLIAVLAASTDRIGEQDELDWPILSHLLAEHSFQEIFQRAYFERHTWGVPCDDWLAIARPLYENHPMAALLDFYRDDATVSQQALKRAETIDRDTLEIAGRYIADIQPNPRTGATYRRGMQTMAAAAMHMDRTLSDIAQRLRHVNVDFQRRDSVAMYKLSPYSPFARNMYLAYHWDKVKPQIGQWLREGAQDSAQLAAIAQRYAADKQLDTAITLYQQACKLSPDMSNYRALANAYRAQGKIDQWQATLVDYLKQPDYGLGHAAVQQEIAHFYMGRHEWEKALPFAQGAADDSFASWALTTVASCHEALSHWAEAENKYRMESERYETLQWFYFTRRTGQGDAAAAERFAKTLLEADKGKRRPLPDKVGFALLQGKADEALSLLETGNKRELSPAGGLHIALLAEIGQDLAKRDAALRDVIELSQKKEPKLRNVGLFALARLIEGDIRDGGQANIDSKALDTLWRSSPVAEQPAVEHLAGRYLDLHGKAELAQRFWLYQMSHGAINDWYRTLTGAELLARGIKPEAYRRELLTVVDSPPPEEPMDEAKQEQVP